MPNRILKESICTSESIDALKPFEEIFYYRLIVNCDDFGRMDAREKILRSKLFPLKDSATLKNIADGLQALVSVGLVVRYKVDGKPFLFLPTWELHQQMRAKRSKYPAPDITCNQMISDDCKCPRNPIQSESESESESNTNRARAEDRFDEFWTAYPKKVGKEAARKAYAKIRPTLALHDCILAAIALQAQSAQWQKQNGQFIPNPATWLNQGRWDDEVQAAIAVDTTNPFVLDYREEAGNGEGRS